MPRATIEAEAAETNPDNGKAFLAITVGWPSLLPTFRQHFSPFDIWQGIDFAYIRICDIMSN